MTADLNLNDDKLKQLMLDIRSIGIVGLSRDPSKPSYEVSKYIQSQGYELTPVNPHADSVLGRKSIGSLAEADQAFDAVVVFRRSEDIPDVVQDLLKMPGLPKLVWLQLGIRNDDAVKPLLDKGVTVVQDRCFMVEHRRMLGKVNV